MLTKYSDNLVVYVLNTCVNTTYNTQHFQTGIIRVWIPPPPAPKLDKLDLISAANSKTATPTDQTQVDKQHKMDIRMYIIKN